MSEINPPLNSQGKYKGDCCRITANWDNLINFKAGYHEDWKNKVCQLYGVDPSISDDELREIVNSNQIKDKCQILLDSNKKTTLYSSALLTVDKKIQYNCGSGEETFYAKDFIPKDETEALAKDIMDCNNGSENYIEKNCNKQGNKLSTKDALCCWCETTYLSELYSAANSQACTGRNINKFKETLTALKNAYASSNLQLKYECRCTNREGEVIKGSFDSSSDEVIVN